MSCTRVMKSTIKEGGGPQPEGPEDPDLSAHEHERGVAWQRRCHFGSALPHKGVMQRLFRTMFLWMKPWSSQPPGGGLHGNRRLLTDHICSATQTPLGTSDTRLRNKAACNLLCKLRIKAPGASKLLVLKIKGESPSGRHPNGLNCCRPLAAALKSPPKAVQNFSNCFANNQTGKQASKSRIT